MKICRFYECKRVTIEIEGLNLCDRCADDLWKVVRHWLVENEPQKSFEDIMSEIADEESLIETEEIIKEKIREMKKEGNTSKEIANEVVRIVGERFAGEV